MSVDQLIDNYIKETGIIGVGLITLHEQLGAYLKDHSHLMVLTPKQFVESLEAYHQSKEAAKN